MYHVDGFDALLFDQSDVITARLAGEDGWAS
jgi:hypothetical protein